MKDFDVVCAGISVVNFPIYPVDEKLFSCDITQVNPIMLLPGGDAANQSIVLSRLGNKTALITQRGNDLFGTIMLELLHTFGRDIDLSKVAVDEKHATAVCAMMIKPNGQRHFCAYRGAINSFCLENIDLSVLKRTKIASIGGLMGLPSFDGAGSAKFFRTAKEYDVITVADTKVDLEGIGLKGILSTLQNTDYFFPSYDEASVISGEKNPEKIARVFLDAGVKHLGIKLGSDGCYFKDEQTEFYLPVIPNEVVDTTGAGDNFMSGFITGLVQGWDIRKCCQFASATGAICVGQVGPNDAVKNIDQVMNFMEGSKILL
jgi:sugar/nucleoside kinase (ribokinase family)